MLLFVYVCLSELNYLCYRSCTVISNMPITMRKPKNMHRIILGNAKVGFAIYWQCKWVKFLKFNFCPTIFCMANPYLSFIYMLTDIATATMYQINLFLLVEN